MSIVHNAIQQVVCTLPMATVLAEVPLTTTVDGVNHTCRVFVPCKTDESAHALITQLKEFGSNVEPTPETA